MTLSEVKTYLSEVFYEWLFLFRKQPTTYGKGHLCFHDAAMKLCNKLISLQAMIENYYEPMYKFKDFCKDLKNDKVHGDELYIVLLSRYLRRNITVLSPFDKWKMYPTLQDDIILMFDGRYWPTQNLSQVQSEQSKENYLLDLFLNKYPTN